MIAQVEQLAISPLIWVGMRQLEQVELVLENSKFDRAGCSLNCLTICSEHHKHQNERGTGIGGNALPGPAPNTAGPHKQDWLNKLDPRVNAIPDQPREYLKFLQSTCSTSNILACLCLQACHGIILVREMSCKFWRVLMKSSFLSPKFTPFAKLNLRNYRIYRTRSIESHRRPNWTKQTIRSDDWLCLQPSPPRRH